jgi:hypothetical protein
MDTGAPMPAVERSGDGIILAYICSTAAVPDHSAIIRFRDVSWLHFGYPNDEGLREHPFYDIGLRHYAFWEVLDSPKVSAGSSHRHWIGTFHDETLEVLAASATVIHRGVTGTATREIARKYV